MSADGIERRVVIEISPTVDSDGTTQKFLFGEKGFATLSTDTPAETSVRELLQSAGIWEQDLFAGSRMGGAVKPGGGTITLINEGGVLDAWADYGVDGAMVTCRWGPPGAAYPSGYSTVYVARGHWISATERVIEIALKDRSYLLDKAIVTGTFAGTGGLEGDFVVARKRQWVASDPGFAPPIKISSTLRLYFVQDAATGGTQDTRFLFPTDESIVCPFDTFVGGVRLTRGANYSSETECLTTAPSAGQVRFYFGPDGVGANKLGPVYMRLGTEPTYQVRVFMSGYAPDGNSWTYDRMVARSGLDVASYYSTGGGVSSRLVDDDSTYLEVMDEAGFVDLVAYGFTRLDEFYSVRLDEPASSDTIVYLTTATGTTAVTRPVFTFTPDNSRDFKRLPVPGMEAPYWQVNVAAGDVWPCECDPTASATMREYLSREEAWAAFSGTNAAIKTRHPGAVTAEFTNKQRSFQNTLEQSLWVNRYLTLFGGLRWIAELVVDMTDATLAIGLMDNAIVQYPRFGCTSGRAFRVVSHTIDVDAKTITFRLWGGTAGPGGYITTGSGSAPVVVNPSIARSAMGDFTVFGAGSIALAGRSFLTLGDFVGASLGTQTAATTETILQMDFEGANNSTVFTDSSTYARAITHKHPAGTLDIKISTSSPLAGTSSGVIADAGNDDQLLIDRDTCGDAYLPADFSITFKLQLVDDPMDIAFSGNTYAIWAVYGYDNGSALPNADSLVIFIDSGAAGGSGEICIGNDPSMSTAAIRGLAAFPVGSTVDVELSRVGTTLTLKQAGVSQGTATSNRIFGNNTSSGGTRQANFECIGSAGLSGAFPTMKIDSLLITRG